MTTTIRVRDRMRTIIDAVCNGVYDKQEPIRLALLACIAGESIFLLGPPGVAKSLIARRVKYAFRDAKSFEYLMGRFSTPEELFGPISISKLRDQDSYERIVDNYLPTADIVFLDEVWKASPPIQNALLTALNEKLYRNGNRELQLPMKGFIAASNELPAPGEGLDAFWDRFLLRLVLDGVDDDAVFFEMVTDVRDVYRDEVPAAAKISDEEYRTWQREIDAVSTGEEVVAIVREVRAGIAAANVRLEREGSPPIFVSDRRWKKIFRLLRTSAFLNGRTAVDAMDCFFIAHTIWSTREQIPECRAIVQDAIRRHGYTSSVEPSDIESDLAALRQEIEHRTIQTSEEERLVPALYDGEYLRVLDFDRSSEVKIWKGDFDAVCDGDVDAIELFHFDRSGNFSRSESHSVTAIPPDQVTIDGKSYHIETRTEISSITSAAMPENADIERWDRAIDTLLDRSRELLGRILQYGDAEKEEAEANLFVPRDLAAIAFENLEAAERHLAHLTVEIEECRASYRSLS